MVLHRGKIATQPEILEIRPLTRDDLALIPQKRDGTDRSGGNAVARFRDPHHRVARLFAAGLRISEIQARTGYSYNRLSQFQTDPAFQDLIAKYRSKVDLAFVSQIDEYYELATANMRMAERQIAERLEEADDPDAPPIPLKTLVDISGDRMDRFGYGKRQTNLNVNADFASLLEAAIKRSGKTPHLIEASVLSPHHTEPQSPPEPSASHALPAESPKPATERKLLRRA